MAVGKNYITIDSDELVQGITTSSNLTDGGISPESCAINLMANPGVVYPTNGYVDLGPMSTSAPVASTFGTAGPTTGFQIQKWILDAAGSVYYINNGVLGKTAGTSAAAYLYGQADLLMYQGILYATSTSNINKYTPSYGLTPNVTETASWWTGTVGQSTLTASPHPMTIFNRILFIADGYFLHTYDGNSGGAGAVSAVLTLNTTETITAIENDPQTGRLLVAISSSNGGFSSSSDATQTVNTGNFIGLYDGTNPTQLLRKVPVEAPVSAFRNVGGQMYVVYGRNLGVWTGSGIQFVRNFRNDMPSGVTNVTYKHQISNVADMLLVADNSGNPNPYTSNGTYQILAVGQVKPGVTSVFPIVNAAFQIELVDNLYYSPSSLNGIMYTILGGDGNYHVVFTSAYSHSTVLSTGDSSPLYVSKRVAFPVACTVNQVRVFYEDVITPGQGTIGQIGVVSDRRSTDYTITVTDSNTYSPTRFDANPGIVTTDMQVTYRWLETSTSHGIQKIMIFYTPYE